MGTYGPGDLLGILATLDGGARHFTAVAREATSAMLLDRRDFTAIVDSRPELNVHIKRDLCNEMRKITSITKRRSFSMSPPGYRVNSFPLSTSRDKR